VFYSLGKGLKTTDVCVFCFQIGRAVTELCDALKNELEYLENLRRKSFARDSILT